MGTLEEHDNYGIEWEEDSLLHLESQLRRATHERRNTFSHKEAQRHFNEGFIRRHYMIQSSRLFLDRLTKSRRREPLSPYEATDCAIHINAYYLNLRGALDNLAWVLQYEWKLLPDVSEDQTRGRQSCSLFGASFLAALEVRKRELASVIRRYRDWATELAEMRDPAAHRVPIYIPPAVMTSQEQLDEFHRIEALADLPAAERGDRPISDVYREAQAVADFLPIMIMSTPQGIEIRPIAAQVAQDHRSYLTVAENVVVSL